MRVTILHNPDAGDASIGGEELTEMFRAVGYDADYKSIKEKGWKDALNKPGDFIVGAGGDGTIRQIARELIGRQIPIAPLPMGTANNIARAVGVGHTPIPELIESWTSARRVSFDVGVVKTAAGENIFLESTGFGLLARLIAEDPDSIETQEERGERIDAAIEATQDLLKTLVPQKIELKLDGYDLSGEYLMVEIMNVPYVGPNLKLAGDADPSDQLLDVVLVSRDEQDKLQDYLRAHRQEAGVQPSLRPQRARTIEFTCNGCTLHIDDELWPSKKMKMTPEPTTIHISCHNDLLEFMVPR